MKTILMLFILIITSAAQAESVMTFEEALTQVRSKHARCFADDDCHRNEICLAINNDDEKPLFRCVNLDDPQKETR